MFSFLKPACWLAAPLTALLINQSDAQEQLYRQSPVEPSLSKQGAFTAAVTTTTIIHKQQFDFQNPDQPTDRHLTLEIWYPSHASGKPTHYNDQTRLGKHFSLQGTAIRDAAIAQGTFPLVVISHGYTGYRSLMFYLAEHLASHGFVVAAIDHTDSTNADVDFINSPFSGFMSTLYNRGRDQQFTLEALYSLPRFAKKLQPNAAIIGYSMGGYGAINTVGGCYHFSAPVLQQLNIPSEQHSATQALLNQCNAGQTEVDARWQAMIAIAPWGQNMGIHTPESLANISVPSLYIAGEFDDISGFSPGVKTLFEQTNATKSHLLVYENARHNIASHPAPLVATASEHDYSHYAEANWSSQTINAINEHFVLAFLNCKLKQQSEACSYLPTREHALQQTAEDKPWPGFKERFGLGLRFYTGKGE